MKEVVLPILIFLAIGAVGIRFLIQGRRRFKVQHPHIGMQLTWLILATMTITIGACIVLYVITVLVTVVITAP